MNSEIPEKLRVEFVKGNLFRVVHADGAYGGITPRLDLFITFYTERFPIPKVLTFEMSPEGVPAKEVSSERESKEGVIRECEIGVVVDLPIAKSFLQWLTEKVAELEEAKERVGKIAKEEGVK
jgi:hypothetical protein